MVLEGRAPPLEERSPPLEERSPPLEERSPPLEERSPPLEGRAPASPVSPIPVVPPKARARPSLQPTYFINPSYTAFNFIATSVQLNGLGGMGSSGARS